MTEHRIGVEDPIQHPSHDELELLDHGYIHNLRVHSYKSRGYIQHPDYPSIAGRVPGYYVLMYKGEK